MSCTGDILLIVKRSTQEKGNTMDMGIVSAVVITLATVCALMQMSAKVDPERMALSRREEDRRSVLHTLLLVMVFWAFGCLVPVLVLAGF